MIHDWLVMLRSSFGQSQSTHYVPRAEAERIASVARTLECTVVDGPRQMTAREMSAPAERGQGSPRATLADALERTKRKSS